MSVALPRDTPSSVTRQPVSEAPPRPHADPAQCSPLGLLGRTQPSASRSPGVQGVSLLRFLPSTCTFGPAPFPMAAPLFSESPSPCSSCSPRGDFGTCVTLSERSVGPMHDLQDPLLHNY